MAEEIVTDMTPEVVKEDALQEKPAPKKSAAKKTAEPKKAPAKKTASKETKEPKEKKAAVKKENAPAAAVKAEEPKKQPAKKEAPKKDRAEARLRITLVKSHSGRTKKQLATLHSLGLRRIGHQTEQPDNAATRGKINKISHLVQVSTI